MSTKARKALATAAAHIRKLKHQIKVAHSLGAHHKIPALHKQLEWWEAREEEAYLDKSTPDSVRRNGRGRKRHYKRNPSTQTWLLLALGGAVVGVGAYYLFFKKSAAPTPTPVGPGGKAAPVVPPNPVVPGGGGTVPALPALPALTPEQQAMWNVIAAQIQTMPGTSDACKQKMLTSGPFAMQLEVLESNCKSAPAGNQLCAQLPNLKAQLAVMQEDFTRTCPPPP